MNVAVRIVNMFSYNETFDKVLNVSCKKKKIVYISLLDEKERRPYMNLWYLYSRALDFFTT